jgi:hypothetical protein
VCAPCAPMENSTCRSSSLTLGPLP